MTQFLTEFHFLVVLLYDQSTIVRTMAFCKTLYIAPPKLRKLEA